MALRYGTPDPARRSLQVNLTSLVDVSFLLIIFFVLISRFTSAENIKVELPQPEHSVAAVMEFPDRVVLNCRFFTTGPDRQGTVRYLLGPIPIEDVGELRGQLQAVKQQRPDVQVILRADRRIRYQHIRQAMAAIAEAGISNMNIAAEAGD